MADEQTPQNQTFAAPRLPTTAHDGPSSSSLEGLQSEGQTQKDTAEAGQPQPPAHPAAPSLPGPRKSESAVWKHLTATIRPTLLAEIELVLLTICTGLQDGVTFADYHCFASNQTGNTVFLLLALVLPRMNGEMFITANIGAALGFFLAAGWLTGQLSHRMGPRCRLWLVACNLLQAILVFAAAAVQSVHGIELRGPAAVAVIALLAFASGSQVVQSRSLAMTEISTAMATAAWIDLLIDPRLLAVHNRPRTRRVVFLAALVAGVLLGAGLYRTVGSSVAVFLSAGGKALAAFMYLFNEEDKPAPEPEKGADRV